MIEPQLQFDKIKIVGFKKAFMPESVPQSGISQEKALSMKLPPYKWNSEEMRVIQFHGYSMECLSCKNLN